MSTRTEKPCVSIEKSYGLRDAFNGGIVQELNGRRNAEFYCNNTFDPNNYAIRSEVLQQNARAEIEQNRNIKAKITFVYSEGSNIVFHRMLKKYLDYSSWAGTV